MQKVTAFLERYVEWVAIALGGAFMLFMIFVYLIGTPISAKVGANTVTLVNVESSIYDDAGHKLELAMSDTNVPNATMEAYAAKFGAFMSLQGVPLPQYAAGPAFSGGAPAKPLTSPLEKPGDKGTALKVQGLPGPLPAPKFFAYSEGRSNVQVNPPADGAMPAAMGGMAFPPGMMDAAAAGSNDEQQPAAPGRTSSAGAAAPAARGMKRPAAVPVAAAGPAGAATAKPDGTDKIWLTQAFTIPTDAIVDAFDNAKIPANLTTLFLRVEVIRQEQMPDGSWGNETQIQPLAFHQVPAYPKEGSNIEEGTYQEWAVQHTQTLLAPSFYPKVAGDTWFAPGQPDPNKGNVVRPVVNPLPVPVPRMRGRGAAGMGGPGMGGPPIGTGGPGGGRPRGGGRGASYAPDDPQRPSSSFMQAAPPGPPRGGMPPEALKAAQAAAQAAAAAAQARAMGGGNPGTPAAGPMGFPTGAVPSFGEAQASVPDGYKIPSGYFNPGDLDADVFGWFHDDTVQPGKTYHYKVAYKLRNPLYRNAKLAGDPKLADVFAITSPMSEWSDAVTIEPVTKFYVAAGVPAGASTVRFDVYHWQDGKWQTKQFTAAPGDQIGSNDGSVNYDTGWALADLDSTAMSRAPVIVADAQGKLDSRGFNSDQDALKEFKKQTNIDSGAPKTVPGMGPAGFVPGMGGPGPGFIPPMMGPGPGFVPPPGVGTAPQRR